MHGPTALSGDPTVRLSLGTAPPQGVGVHPRRVPVRAAAVRQGHTSGGLRVHVSLGSASPQEMHSRQVGVRAAAVCQGHTSEGLSPSGGGAEWERARAEVLRDGFAVVPLTASDSPAVRALSPPCAGSLEDVQVTPGTWALG